MCEICGQSPCHPRCPNYSPTGNEIMCEICANPILDGEEYVENELGYLAHYECLNTVRQTVDWLGFDIKTMGD